VGLIISTDIYGPGGAEAVANLMRARGMIVPYPLSNEVSGTPVVAVANNGRWIAECECRSAQLIDPDDIRFFCVRCFNANNDGKWRPVTWPLDAEDIEKALLVRPDKANQNWLPTETVASLEAENEAHGLPPRLEEI
jgi:hypothetical protein